MGGAKWGIPSHVYQWACRRDPGVAAYRAAGTQLGVIATGLTAVVGSTAWQVIWLLGVAVRVLVAAFGPPGNTGSTRDGGEGGNAGAGGGS